MHSYVPESFIWLFIFILTGVSSLGLVWRVFLRVHLHRFIPIPWFHSVHVPVTSFSAIFKQRRLALTAPQPRATIWFPTQVFNFVSLPLRHSPWLVETEHFDTFIRVSACIYKHIKTTCGPGYHLVGRESARKFLCDLVGQPGYKTSDFDFAKVFGSVASFTGLLWLAECRALVYPSQVQTSWPVLFDIPVECYARLCGISMEKLHRVTGNVHIYSEWSAFLRDCAAPESELEEFGRVLGRLFGGNHALLSRPMRREEKWNPKSKLEYSLIIQQIVFNMALCCDLTPELQSALKSCEDVEEIFSD